MQFLRFLCNFTGSIKLLCIHSELNEEFGFPVILVVGHVFVLHTQRYNYNLLVGCPNVINYEKHCKQINSITDKHTLV